MMWSLVEYIWIQYIFILFLCWINWFFQMFHAYISPFLKWKINVDPIVKMTTVSFFFQFVLHLYYLWHIWQWCSYRLWHHYLSLSTLWKSIGSYWSVVRDVITWAIISKRSIHYINIWSSYRTHGIWNLILVFVTTQKRRWAPYNEILLIVTW